ncbi:MAG: DNA-directed RNA polymerase subunit beta [Planctomycetota bacterium]|nr:DNA-directed RNA polymerase subunit beta [Planctomycetota bacterium]
MPVSAIRILDPKDTRNFSRYGEDQDTQRVDKVPPLTDIQLRSYERFLQYDIAPDKRELVGIEGVLREIFPIESYDKTSALQFLRYELGKPRFGMEECRQLRLTYGRPFKVFLRLAGEQAVEEEVYLGDMPIMSGGGEFIINGAERVVVSQLHRSPGVDFVVATEGDKKLHSCRIIPERGSWIELNVTKKDSLSVRIDQSGKFSAMTLLRAMDPRFSRNADILASFHPTKQMGVDKKSQVDLLGKQLADDVIDPETGEVYFESGQILDQARIDALQATHVTHVQIIDSVKEDPLVMAALTEDQTSSHEEALLKIYQRMRPGNPASLEKARELFKEKFLDSNRYRLGKVGRFRINRKFQQSSQVPDDLMTLDPFDLVNAIRYILKLRAGDGLIDDIDHLGNRRVRTIDELAADELRKGFLKLRRTVQERMQNREKQDLTPRSLINPKSVSAAIEYFFGRGELSQVVDQTNPLSQLTHERRLSALGPGGLNRKRAGFDVRDVHISHYGRICPIETPEGTNIGLISHLSIYAGVDDYGFLITPYRVVINRKVTTEVRWLRGDEESHAYIAPADTEVEGGVIIGSEGRLIVRKSGEFVTATPDMVEYIDVSPRQMVGVSAGLIPFLEHDDANRALMGSNMQRQAVPLLVTEPPIVCTGLERDVAQNSGLVVKAERDGVVKYVDSIRIRVDEKEYLLEKFIGLNEHTCQNQKPLVKMGEKVKKGQVIADGAATHNAELALGRNVLVAFMSWEGYNFEDAIIISERLVEKDTYTSVHIEEFEIEIRESKLGKEEFTRDIPNVSPKALNNLDDAGIVRVGTFVSHGDILVGKVVPKAKSELTPEEKLLHAIFGRAGEDVKNESLEVPPGVEGIVITTERFSRRANMTDVEKKDVDRQDKEIRETHNARIVELYLGMIEVLCEQLKVKSLKDSRTNKILGGEKEDRSLVDQASEFRLDHLDLRSPEQRKIGEEIYLRHKEQIDLQFEIRDRMIVNLKRGDELPNGVQQMVKVYVATKRVISVGDKMAGRHGNKGVISKILPVEDMPFLADGTPVDILLNTLGVRSRMNVGQILETHLGAAARNLNFKAITPVFDGASEEEIRECLKEAGLPESGKSYLFDGRTGDRFEQPVTVGFIYMLKLHHLVDDKVHARATGPYSLITQQPLGGKARFGGQRFGEMEVWALEAYGAAYILQELLTVKSDDVDGRTKIYESMVKGENTLEAGLPASFDVLTNEIKGLALNLQLEKKDNTEDLLSGSM